MAGQSMFNEGIQGKEIARILGVSEQTVVTWKRKYDWEDQRRKKTLARETAEDAVWELINYQLDALKKIKEAYRNDNADKPKLLDKGDIDALTKMFSTIKGKQLEWSSYVKIIREFVDHIQAIDIELAKAIIDMSDAFLNKKRTEL